MTQFGVRPDSQSFLSKKIEAFAKARAAQRQIPVIHVLHTYVLPIISKPIISKPDWRPLRESLCEKYAADQVRVLRVRVLALKWQRTRTAPPRASGTAVLAMVAEEHRLAVDVVRGVSRTHVVCLARHHAAFEISVRTQLSLGQIGKILGGRDHTSVGYMVTQHAARHDLPVPRGLILQKKTKRRQIAYSGEVQFA